MAPRTMTIPMIASIWRSIPLVLSEERPRYFRGDSGGRAGSPPETRRAGRGQSWEKRGFRACQKHAHPGTIGLKTYADTRTGHRPRRRQGNAAGAAYQRTGQTGRPVRWQVPDYRLRAEQLHQFRDLFDLCADP